MASSFIKADDSMSRDYGEESDESSPVRSLDGRSYIALSAVSPSMEQGQASTSGAFADAREIRKGSKVRYRHCGVTVQYTEGSTEETFKMACQCVSPEQCDPEITLADREELLSDKMVFRLEKSGENPLGSKLTFPLFRAPLPEEEVVVKTNNSNNSLKVTRIRKKKKRWYCTVRGDLSTFSAMLAVSKWRTEVFVVDQAATTLRTSLQEGAELRVDADTFSGSAHIQLQIMGFELPDSSISMLSATPFYGIFADGNPELKPIHCRVPLPQHHKRGGKLVVVSKTTKTEDHWQVLDFHPEINEAYVHFSSTCSSWNVCVEVGDQGLTEMTVGSIQHDIAQAFSGCRRQAMQVCFLVFAKPSERTQVFDVAVECCLRADTSERRQHWCREGFTEQFSSAGIASSKESYSITCSKNFRMLEKDCNAVLQFHCKRQNFRRFKLEVVQEALLNATSGHINITQLGESGTTIEDACIRAVLDLMRLPVLDSGSSDAVPKSPRRKRHKRKEKKRKENLHSVTDTESATKDTIMATEETGKKLELRAIQPINSKVLRVEEPVVERHEPEKAASPTRKVIRVNSSIGQDTSECRVLVDVEVSRKVPPDHAKHRHQAVTASPVPFDRFAHVKLKFAKNGREFLQEYCRNHFLDDWFLRQLLDLIEEDWCPFLCLLGIPFATIEKVMDGEDNIKTKLIKLLQKWRDDSLQYTDRGLPTLLAATGKAGRRDLTTFTLTHLKYWNDANLDNEDSFASWLRIAYESHDLLIPPDYPEPLSDQYLAMIGSHMTPSVFLANSLLVPPDRFSALMEEKDGPYANFNMTMLKMLTSFRERVQDRTKALSTILRTIEDTEDETTMDYAVNCLKGWYGRTAMKDDPFRVQVKNLLDHQPSVKNDLKARSAPPTGRRTKLGNNQSHMLGRTAVQGPGKFAKYGRRSSKRDLALSTPTQPINRKLLVLF